LAEEIPVVDAAPAAKSKLSSYPGSLITMILIVLFSNAAGAGATWLFVRRAVAAQTAPKGDEKGKETIDMAEQLQKSAVVPLEPFVVNLADSDAARYLRIKVNLMVDDKTKLKEIEENQALQLKVRDVILQTLTRKTSKDLTNDEGKNKLRHEIQDEIGPFFKTPKLNDVMFTEFVIQL
jgi:flagellar FliL protein